MKQATTSFADRRMDARVHEALSGQRIDTLDVGAPVPAPAAASLHA